MSIISSDDKRGQVMGLGLFTLVGLIALVVGIVMLAERSSDKKRCTEPVSAVVVDFEKRYSRRHRTTYAPVFEYEYGEIKYTYVSSVSSKKPDYSRGDKTTLMIDPNVPTVVYMQNNTTERFSTVCLISGIIFATFGGIGIKITLSDKR